jgi:hypothetical protein
MELERKLQRARERGAALEQNLRSAAFLPFNETICGIKAVPLTLRILGRLRHHRSPFLVGGRIRPGHCVAFLWAVSPDYGSENATRAKAKERLVERAAVLPERRAIKAIRKYLFLAWMDRPPVRRARKDDLAAISFDAAMIHHIANAYGWDDETILDKPLKRLYQYLTMIRIDGNAEAVTFNPIVDRLVRAAQTKPTDTRL